MTRGIVDRARPVNPQAMRTVSNDLFKPYSMVDIHMVVNNVGSLSQLSAVFTNDSCPPTCLTRWNCFFNRYWSFMCCRLDRTFCVRDYRKTLRVVRLIIGILNIDSSTISYASKSNNISGERCEPPVVIGENLNKTN
jgi:hypothetical protein